MNGFDPDGMQSDASRDFCMQMGAVVSLMLENASYRRFPLASLIVWVEPAIALRQLRIYFDARGRPVGYLTWAFLTEELTARMASQPETLLHVSEWNEGEDLWIMDFFAKPGYAALIACHARSDLFPRDGEARWLRRSKNGNVRKVQRLRRYR